jgi:hypothetical protein
MQTHELKTWPEFFAPMLSGEKTFDLRKDDRGFQIGDQLRLREWSPETKTYSGREVTKSIRYMLAHRPGAGCAADFGLAPGYAILGLC